MFPPDYELEVYRAWAKALGPDSVRYDPNAAFSVEQALRFGRAIEDLNNDYYEDPAWGLAACAECERASAFLLRPTRSW